ncbi:hypothetical protein ACKWTF_011464 [Chironomus riparius]
MKIFIFIFCIKITAGFYAGGPSISNNPNYNSTFFWNGQRPNYDGPTFNSQTPNYDGQYSTNWNSQNPPAWNGQNPTNWNSQNPPDWNRHQPPTWNEQNLFNQNSSINTSNPPSGIGQRPPIWNGPIPYDESQYPEILSNKNPSVNPLNLNTQNPIDANPTFIPQNSNENQDPNEIELFYEIGSPISRIKRDVRFPDDDENVNSQQELPNIESHNNTIGDVLVVSNMSKEGRASKQMMQSVTKIDVGPQSQLFVAPGSTSVIYFEVTNLRNEPTYHSFNVQDEKRYLRQMEPRFFWLRPHQRESVRVTIMIPQGTELGIKDKITLTSQSIVQTQQSVAVTVTTNGVVDSWQPRLWYTYSTRCDWRWNCVGGIWSVEVVARDYETGMLSLRSNPEGLLLRAPFTAGTTEEVHATFSASCCEPKVSITAYDLNRNQRTLQLDVDWPWLSEYGIATVVLGCLFFILLIILIVIWVRWCIKRRRERNDYNLDGPIH